MGFLKRLSGGSSEAQGRDTALTRREIRDGRFTVTVEEILRSGLSEKEKEAALQSLAQTHLDGKERIIQKDSGIKRILRIIFGVSNVPIGHVAIVTDRGIPREGIQGPGPVLGIPGLTQAETYSIRVQRYDFKIRVFTSRRQPVELDLIVQHQLQKGGVDTIFANAGPEYVKTSIEPYLITAIRKIVYGLKEEEVLNPEFEGIVTASLEAGFASVGIAVRITVKDVLIAPVVAQAFSKITEAEMEQMTLDANITLFAVQAKYALMLAGLKKEIKLVEADIEASVKRIITQMEIDMEKQRRQPGYFSEEYYRDRLIQAGLGSMLGEGIMELARALAQIAADRLGRS